MTRLKSALAAALFTFAGATADAQALPNFSGTWELNTSKSSFGQFPAPAKSSMAVTQDATTIKVGQSTSTPNGDVTMNLVYSLDGKPTAGTGYGGATTTTTAKLDATGLSTATKVSMQQGEMAQSSKWTLSADGNTLTIDQGITSQMGEMSFHMVFDKKP